MKLEILSRAGLERKAREPFRPGTVLISIGDPDALPVKLLHRPEHELRLVFDDMTAAEARERLEMPGISEEELCRVLAEQNTVLFSDEMAAKAAAFVKEHIRQASVFICQCEFGQSRSAAMAAAIAQYYGGYGKKIFANEKYGPNLRVYRKMMAALAGRTVEGDGE